MRTKSDNGVITVHAISGTKVVLLGLDVKNGLELAGLVANTSLAEQQQRKDKKKPSTKDKKSPMFIGFSIARTDLETGETISLNEDGKPIQRFVWGDYDVESGKEYQYTIRQLTNGRSLLSVKAKAVGMGAALQVRVTTEDPSQGTHGIFFNRGVAGSHAYNTKFSEHRKWHLVSSYGVPVWRNIINPREIPDPEESREALAWLSRGLEEALLDFISQATGGNFQIRAAVYEFTHPETIQALADAVERGVCVKIIRHCKGAHRPKVKRDSIVKDKDGNIVTEWIPDSTTDEASKAIRNVGFKSLNFAKIWHSNTFIERKHSSALMHNKFIILLEGGEPKQVWTGSTNFTDGGIYGQANVGHIVRDVDIARRYLTYWNALSLDPPGRSRRRSHLSYSDLSDNTSEGSENNDEPNEVVLEQAILDENAVSPSLESIDEEPLCIDEAEQAALFLNASESVKQEPMTMVNQIERDQPDLTGPLATNAIKVIFSPRSTTGMLQFYADRMKDASTCVHLTAPFGVSQQFGQVLMGGTATATDLSTNQDGLRRSPRIARQKSDLDVAQPNATSPATLLRYILLDKKPSEKSSAKAKAASAKKGKSFVDYFDFKKNKENRIAWGAVLSNGEDEEDLTGLTTFVDFVHLKCLLVDAISENPTVIAGSANFSEASTDKNDENMLVISGDTGVADVYFTEYMRLFDHFYSRDNQQTLTKDSTKQKKKKPFGWGQIVDDSSWLQPYFDPSNQLCRERLLLR